MKVDTIITYEMAKDLLQRAVEERGEDYVYPRASSPGGCVYFEDDGTPSCIVGHVLAYLGYTKDDIEDFNDQSVGAVSDAAPMDFQARWLLRDAQIRQDQGTPWGRAVSEAIASMESPLPEAS